MQIRAKDATIANRLVVCIKDNLRDHLKVLKKQEPLPVDFQTAQPDGQFSGNNSPQTPTARSITIRPIQLKQATTRLLANSPNQQLTHSQLNLQQFTEMIKILPAAII